MPSFAAAVLDEMRRLDDTKPGVLSRALLPILQSHCYVAPFCLPSKVFDCRVSCLCLLLSGCVCGRLSS